MKTIKMETIKKRTIMKTIKQQMLLSMACVAFALVSSVT